jgi:hypothetical protein
MDGLMDGWFDYITFEGEEDDSSLLALEDLLLMRILQLRVNQQLGGRLPNSAQN